MVSRLIGVFNGFHWGKDALCILKGLFLYRSHSCTSRSTGCGRPKRSLNLLHTLIWCETAFPFESYLGAPAPFWQERRISSLGEGVEEVRPEGVWQDQRSLIGCPPLDNDVLGQLLNLVDRISFFERSLTSNIISNTSWSAMMELGSSNLRHLFSIPLATSKRCNNSGWKQKGW